jgi:hypothetical protein
MSGTFVTIGAQQALAIASASLSQSTSPTGTVSGTGCNALITTQTFTNGPGTAVSFAYTNPLISNTTDVSAIIASASSSSGNPSLTLSGQSTGAVYFTITNESPSVSMNGTLGISVLVYHL